MKVLILILLSIKSLSACCRCCASGSDDDSPPVVVRPTLPPPITTLQAVQPVATTASQTSSGHAPNPFLLDDDDDRARPRESSCAAGLTDDDDASAPVVFSSGMVQRFFPQSAADGAGESPQPQPLQIDPSMSLFCFEREITEAALTDELSVLRVLNRTNPTYYGNPIDTEGNTIFHHICYLGFLDAAATIAKRINYNLDILSKPNVRGVVPIQIANGFPLGTPQRKIFVFLKRHDVPLPDDPLEKFVAFPGTPLMRLGSFGRALREGGAGS